MTHVRIRRPLSIYNFPKVCVSACATHVIGRHRQSATCARVPVHHTAATDADVPRARGHAHDVHNLAGVQSTDTDVQAM